MSRTVRATEHVPVDFFAMSDDCAATVLTSRSELVNGAFEAVKCVVRAIRGPDDKCLVIVVSANLTPGHIASIHRSDISKLISTVWPIKRCSCADLRRHGERFESDEQLRSWADIAPALALLEPLGA
jgi:hypothetical protein